MIMLLAIIQRSLCLLSFEVQDYLGMLRGRGPGPTSQALGVNSLFYLPSAVRREGGAELSALKKRAP